MESTLKSWLTHHLSARVTVTWLSGLAALTVSVGLYAADYEYDPKVFAFNHNGVTLSAEQLRAEHDGSGGLVHECHLHMPASHAGGLTLQPHVPTVPA